jgi:hypothetical protein
MGTKESGTVDIGVDEGVDLGYGIKDIFLPKDSSIVQCCVSGRRHLQSLHGSFANKLKLNAKIDCVMSLKWSHVR